jgi:hypothetical protein
VTGAAIGVLAVADETTGGDEPCAPVFLQRWVPDMSRRELTFETFGNYRLLCKARLKHPSRLAANAFFNGGNVASIQHYAAIRDRELYDYMNGIGLYDHRQSHRSP